MRRKTKKTRNATVLARAIAALAMKMVPASVRTALVNLETRIAILEREKDKIREEVTEVAAVMVAFADRETIDEGVKH